MTTTTDTTTATCDSCQVRPAGHGHFGLYCAPCSDLPYGQAAPAPVDAIYVMPVIGTGVPCQYHGETSGKANITIPASESKMTKDGQPVAVDLRVSPRSVVTV